MVAGSGYDSGICMLCGKAVRDYREEAPERVSGGNAHADIPSYLPSIPFLLDNLLLHVKSFLEQSSYHSVE